MFSLDKLVSMGFTISQATVINKLFKRVGYLATFTSSDLVSGVTIPDTKIFVLSSLDDLKATFKSSTQFYTDIETIFVQKGNNDPFQGGVEAVVVRQVTESTYTLAVNAFVEANANWAQLCIDSRETSVIQLSAAAANANGRLFIGQTFDDSIKNNTTGNIAAAMAALNLQTCLLVCHPNTEFLAGGLAGIMAQEQLGLTGPLYATVTNCTPQNLSSTVNSNLETLNVSSYQYVNPVNGGGVDEYATPIVYPAKQINGMKTKRAYTIFSLNLLLKAKAVDFLARALTYEDVSAKVLEGMLESVLIEAQKGDGAFKRLVKLDSVDSNGNVVKGFDLKVGRPSDLMTSRPTLYQTETYPVTGYFRDAATGAKVQINLNVDPDNATLRALGFIE